MAAYESSKGSARRVAMREAAYLPAENAPPIWRDFAEPCRAVS